MDTSYLTCSLDFLQYLSMVLYRSLRMKICLSVHGFVVSEKKQWWNTGSKLFAKLSLQKFKLRKPRKKFALQLNMKEMKTLRSRFQTPSYEHGKTIIGVEKDNGN